MPEGKKGTGIFSAIIFPFPIIPAFFLQPYSGLIRFTVDPREVPTKIKEG
jgi:hypothetical protein